MRRRLLPSWAWLGSLLLCIAPASLLGHDEKTMTRAEGERLTGELLEKLSASPALAAAPRDAASPGELKRRLQHLPEVRELIHLRELSAPAVITRLERLRPEAAAEEARLAAALVVVLEASDARASLPALVRLVAAMPVDHPFLPDLATQAIKALSRQADQDLGEVRFSAAVRQRAVEDGRAYATERARGLIAALDGAASLVLGADASGVLSLREILAGHPTVTELTFLSELVCPELGAQLEISAREMPALDLELATFAYVVEKGRCPSALPLLRQLLASSHAVAGELPFSRQFAARALVRGHALPASQRKEIYTESELDEIERLAAAAERKAGSKP